MVDADGTDVGAAIIGRPLARAYDDGWTVEVLRAATDSTPGACSALLGAAWRIARSAGFQRIITYTQAGESGASLRGAGWWLVAHQPPRRGWDTPGRPRSATGTEHTGRLLWEMTADGPHPARSPVPT